LVSINFEICLHIFPPYIWCLYGPHIFKKMPHETDMPCLSRCMKLTCLASVCGLLETVRTVGGNRQYTVYSASSTNTAPPLTNTALDARQSSAPGCATSCLQHHAPSVDSADLLLLLFITPEGSTTQHHHCKDRRKTQETKN